MLQRRLPLQQAVEFFLELLLVEQLAAHDAVDLRAQFGDAILIGKLHLGLPADQPREDIVAKCEIGAGRDGPDGHDDKRADHDPERDRPYADLMSGMRERVAVVTSVQMPGHRGGRLRRGMPGGRAGRRPGNTKRDECDIDAPRRLGPDRTAVQQARYQSDMVKKPVIPGTIWL